MNTKDENSGLCDVATGTSVVHIRFFEGSHQGLKLWTFYIQILENFTFSSFFPDTRAFLSGAQQLSASVWASSIFCQV